MNIQKNLNDYGTFDIDLIKDDKVLSIYQTGADINFSCRHEDYRKISVLLQVSWNKFNNMLFFIKNKGRDLKMDFSTLLKRLDDAVDRILSWKYAYKILN